MDYINFSMSNNAKECYDANIKPLSKWNKSDILNALKEYDINDDVMNKLKTLNTKQLKYVCLKSSEWHHTSKFYNKTDFYDIDGFLEDTTIEELSAMLIKFENKQKEEQAKKQSERQARCKYLVWSGTRNHPHAQECEDVGVIKGNWFYLSNGSKKSINANGFEIIEYLD